MKCVGCGATVVGKRHAICNACDQPLRFAIVDGTFVVLDDVPFGQEVSS